MAERVLLRGRQVSRPFIRPYGPVRIIGFLENSMKSNSRIILYALVFGFASSSAYAQAPKRDAKVQATIDQMALAYRALRSVHIKMVMKPTVSDPGFLKTYSGPESMEIKLQRPNKISLEQWRIAGGQRTHSMIVCDGVNLWKWESGIGTVAREKAPESISDIKTVPNDLPEMDVLLRNKDPFVDFTMGGAEIPLTMGASAKFGDADAESIEAKIPTEGSPISGVLRVRIGQKDHLVRSLSFEGGGKDPKTGKDVTFKFEMTYPILNPSPVFTQADFKFVPPSLVKTAAPVMKTAPGGQATPSRSGKT